MKKLLGALCVFVALAALPDTSLTGGACTSLTDTLFAWLSPIALMAAGALFSADLFPGETHEPDEDPDPPDGELRPIPLYNSAPPSGGATAYFRVSIFTFI